MRSCRGILLLCLLILGAGTGCKDPSRIAAIAVQAMAAVAGAMAGAQQATGTGASNPMTIAQGILQGLMGPAAGPEGIPNLTLGGASGVPGATLTGAGGSAAANQAASIALSQQGKPYVYGAEGPNYFDCSGLVQYSFGNAGVSLPRTAAEQAQVGMPVSGSDLRVGDLVFFNGNGHVGIYVGNDQYVHAPKTGDVVRVSSLSERGDLCGIRRVV